MKDDYKRSRNYMLLIATRGPGSLHLIGWKVTVMERHKYLPLLEAQPYKLDALASQAIIDRIVTYD
jgi:hypothetical protein